MGYSGVGLADLSRGLADERRVIDWLSRGFEVRKATREENRTWDIDCHVLVKGVWEKVSIKSQEAGLTYKNYTLELLSEQPTGHDWTPELSEVYKTIQRHHLDLPNITELVARADIHPSWFLFGLADKY